MLTGNDIGGGDTKACKYAIANISEHLPKCQAPFQMLYMLDSIIYSPHNPNEVGSLTGPILQMRKLGLGVGQ